jgi:hypothetical protein
LRSRAARRSRRVHEPGGAAQRFSAAVEVQTPATFDAELRSRRNTLKARLGRGDVAGALALRRTAAFTMRSAS